MAIERPRVEIDHLTRINEYGPDDLFICCASFEQRCLSSARKMSANYRTNYSIIFVIEDSPDKKQTDTNLNSLKSMLGTRSSKGIFVISCGRDSPNEGIGQLKKIWGQCRPKDSENSFITIDISGFTKIYLLQLLHYLVVELKLGLPRILHTTQTYLPNKLTAGVAQITTVASFFGSVSVEREKVLILFLGFEAERALAVWNHFSPVRTIALITNPPRNENLNYLKYAEKNNACLLSQPSVEVRNVPADDPYAVKKVLEEISDELGGAYNIIVGPFGTKPQVVGLFLFWLEYPGVQVAYSHPTEYTRSYLMRKPGPTLLLPLNP